MIENFETERLRAERLRADHLASLRASLDADPRVMATLGGRTLAEEESRAALQRQLAHWDRHGFGLWVFAAREGGRLVGRGGLQRYAVEGEEVVALLYHLAAPQWGKGFATEIADASLRFGFEALALAEVWCWTLPTNGASKRVMEKCGFRHERDGSFAGLPHSFYRLPADDWRARGPGPFKGRS